MLKNICKNIEKNHKKVYNINIFFEYQGGKEMNEKSIFKDGASKNLTHLRNKLV